MLWRSWHVTGCEVYNLGTGKGTSVLEMVAAFENASGKVCSLLIICATSQRNTWPDNFSFKFLATVIVLLKRPFMVDVLFVNVKEQSSVFCLQTWPRPFIFITINTADQEDFVRLRKFRWLWLDGDQVMQKLFMHLQKKQSMNWTGSEYTI